VADTGLTYRELDRERAGGWTIGQTVAWMFESTHLHTQLATARWLAEAAA
jgi:hypothetical protein